jgi:DTW domain-containing protein YfiP
MRSLCPRCALPMRSCICRWAIAIPNQVELLVLQHPLEAGNAKNSVRLLQLCLPHSHVAVAESFDPEQLDALLHQPLPGAAPNAIAPQPLLLYPQEPGLPRAASVLESAPSPSPSRLRLVALDGTWRKSRRMFDANPALAALPRLALTDPPPSRYRIRRAHRADQLSTLEAVCHALALLEGDAQRYAPLLAAFDGFIAQRIAFIPGAGT